MQFVSGAAEAFPDSLYSQVARYRHRIFVERLGWQLRTENGLELDEFDRPDTVYVVARGEDGGIHGCARLLPTTSPYLLGDVFPQLLNGLPLPSSPEIWELSRFAAVRGAKQLITVSPIGVERLVRRAGFEAHRMGPPMIVDGHPIFACLIPL